MIHQKGALPLLGQDVVEIDVLLEVRVAHRLAPKILLIGCKLQRPVARLMNGAEDVQQVWKRVQHAAGDEVAKAEHPSIGTAGVVRKDCLQSRMPLGRGAPLLACVSRDADHSDIAVTPRLARYPFDYVVVICVLVTILPLGFRRTPRLCDDMHISVCNEMPGVACFDGTEPKWRVCRLRRQRISDIGSLNIFVMQRTRIEHRISSPRVWAIHVQHKARSIAHYNGNVALHDHYFYIPRGEQFATWDHLLYKCKVLCNVSPARAIGKNPNVAPGQSSKLIAQGIAHARRSGRCCPLGSPVGVRRSRFRCDQQRSATDRIKSLSSQRATEVRGIGAVCLTSDCL